MKRTKIAGYLMILIAILNSVLHFVQGGPIDYRSELLNIYAAITGSGFVFARCALEKIETLIRSKLT